MSTPDGQSNGTVDSEARIDLVLRQSLLKKNGSSFVLDQNDDSKTVGQRHAAEDLIFVADVVDDRAILGVVEQPLVREDAGQA